MMTSRQRQSVRGIRAELAALKRRLERLVDATGSGDLDDAAQDVEAAIDCCHACVDNDAEDCDEGLEP